MGPPTNDGKNRNGAAGKGQGARFQAPSTRNYWTCKQCDYLVPRGQSMCMSCGNAPPFHVTAKRTGGKGGGGGKAPVGQGGDGKKGGGGDQWSPAKQKTLELQKALDDANKRNKLEVEARKKAEEKAKNAVATALSNAGVGNPSPSGATGTVAADGAPNQPSEETRLRKQLADLKAIPPTLHEMLGGKAAYEAKVEQAKEALHVCQQQKRSAKPLDEQIASANRFRGNTANAAKAAAATLSSLYSEAAELQSKIATAEAQHKELEAKLQTVDLEIAALHERKATEAATATNPASVWAAGASTAALGGPTFTPDETALIRGLFAHINYDMVQQDCGSQGFDSADQVRQRSQALLAKLSTTGAPSALDPKAWPAPQAAIKSEVGNESSTCPPGTESSGRHPVQGGTPLGPPLPPVGSPPYEDLVAQLAAYKDMVDTATKALDCDEAMGTELRDDVDEEPATDAAAVNSEGTDSSGRPMRVIKQNKRKDAAEARGAFFSQKAKLLK